MSCSNVTKDFVNNLEETESHVDFCGKWRKRATVWTGGKRLTCHFSQAATTLRGEKTN